MSLKLHQTLAALLLATSVLAPAIAAASDDIEDLDSDSRTPRDKTAKPKKEEQVREITRGFYAKANIGAATWLLNYADVLRGGTLLGMTFGDDFIDHERNSMSWEVAFDTGVHNGLHWEQAAQAIGTQLPPEAALQGDTRTFSLLGNLEYSIYPTRRLGVGLRAGGGVMFAPLLMDASGPDGGAYRRDVQPAFGAGAQFLDAAHHDPHPIGFGGGTFEYYTKLSHFSIGADVDVQYAIGWDLGINGTGYMKYTF